jgi:nucleotide-binding universal stress UspA family protein
VHYDGLHVTNDYAADAILDVAKKKKCDAIVMATQGQGGLRGVFIGSVTQKVLNQSKIPVLVLR